MPVAVQRVNVRRHDVFEVAEPVDVDIEDDDVGSKAGGDAGRAFLPTTPPPRMQMRGGDARNSA
ncbi:MAG: hypothetical protein U0872_02225 [Planctomycetaceae bacterium]